MRIELRYHDEILIAPETDFEARWLEDYEPETAFRKYGPSQGDFLGILVKRIRMDSE